MSFQKMPFEATQPPFGSSEINWVITLQINGANLRRKSLPLFGFLATRDNRVAKKPLKTNPPPQRCAGEGGRGEGRLQRSNPGKESLFIPVYFLKFHQFAFA